MIKKTESTIFEVEGQHSQSGQWSVVRTLENEVDARAYRDHTNNRRKKCWMDFRIVRITTMREIVLNNESN